MMVNEGCTSASRSVILTCSPSFGERSARVRRSEVDLGDAHLLEQRQIVLDLPVVRDAAVLRLDEVGGDESAVSRGGPIRDGLAVALDLAEAAGDVAGEAHVRRTRLPPRYPAA